MRVGVLQYAPRRGAVAENLERALALAEPAAREGLDLLVLPELFATGYLFRDAAELRALAEPPDGPTGRALARFCRAHGCHAVAGLPERAAEGVYNAALLVGPDGPLGSYRKVHLFWDEKALFLPGDRGFPVWELPLRGGGSFRLGVLVCFDWAFPEAARSLALAGAQLLAHPSNLVLPHAQGAMRTRALENGVFVATANRCGADKLGGKRLAFSGRSQVVGVKGELLATLGPDDEAVAVAELDPSRADDKQLTPRNHLLRDRRPEQYRLG